MRKGRTIRERLGDLGFKNPDPEERVHDLIDSYEAALHTIENAQARVLELGGNLEQARSKTFSLERELSLKGGAA